MKKSVKLIVLLLVLALLAGGYFLLKGLDLEQKQADAQAAEEAAKNIEIASFDAMNFDSIEVETADDSFVIRTGNEGVPFYAEGMENLTLDPVKVAETIVKLARLTATHAMEEGTDPAEYGLDKPVMTVNYTLKDGSGATYYVGAANPVTHEYYCMVEGDDTIYLMEGAYHDNFANGVVAFAQVETLPDLAGTYVTDYLVDFREGEEKEDVHFVYSAEGFDDVYNYAEVWYYDSPEYGLLSTESVGFSDFISASTTMELEYPIAIADDETIAFYGLDDPMVEVSYQYEAAYEGTVSGTAKILVSDTNPAEDKYYVMLEGGQYIYDMGTSLLTNIFNVDPATHVTPVAIAIDLATIDYIEIDSAAGHYKVEYDTEVTDNEDGTQTTTYYFTSNGVELDEDQAYNWRVFFNELRTEYADTVSFDLNDFDDSKPAATITIHRNTDTFKTITFSFYAYDSSFYICDFEGVRILLFNKNFVNSWVERLPIVLP